MYFEGDEPGPEAEDEVVDEPERRKTAVLGIAAAVLGVSTVAALVTAIVIASTGDWGVATLVAYAAIGLSALSVLGGVIAAIVGLGRRSGVIAVVLGILANPLVLLTVLRFFGGFEAG